MATKNAVFMRLLAFRKRLKRRKKKGETMRLLIVRHGDPDYTIDSLTECSCYIEKQ